MCAQKRTFETDFAKSNNYPRFRKSRETRVASRECLAILSHAFLLPDFPFDPNVPILDVNHLPELTDRRITLFMSRP